MKLQTKIKFESSKNQFGYEDTILLLGSCFAQNIGEKLKYYKFQAVTNPFGIIFNPAALERLTKDAVNDKTYTEEDVFEFNGVWKSFIAHSDLNALTRLNAVIALQEAQQELRNLLTSSSQLFITLGTAWVYRHRNTKLVVANCHKVPQKEFVKELLSVDAISSSLSNIISLVKGLNPTINITFTVSPVRHIKDGILENTRSKSHLIAAVHHAIDAHEVQYFPSYELMMDELRDYRFYASDMLHPSDQAIEYIWEHFIEIYAFAKAKETLRKVASIRKRMEHKPFNPQSDEHKTFVKIMEHDIKLVQDTHPLIYF